MDKDNKDTITSFSKFKPETKLYPESYIHKLLRYGIIAFTLANLIIYPWILILFMLYNENIFTVQYIKDLLGVGGLSFIISSLFASIFHLSETSIWNNDILLITLGFMFILSLLAFGIGLYFLIKYYHPNTQATGLTEKRRNLGDASGCPACGSSK